MSQPFSSAEDQLKNDTFLGIMKPEALCTLKHRVLVERIQGYIKDQCPCLSNALYGFIAEQKFLLDIQPGPADHSQTTQTAK